MSRSTQLDALEFEALLKSPVPEAQKIAVKYFTKPTNFVANQTPATFFTLLESAKSPDLVSTLQTGIVNNASADLANLYQERLQNASSNARKPAILALGKLKNPAHFPKLYAQFLKERDNGLDDVYKSAIANTMTSQYADIVKTGLSSDQARVQSLSL